MPLVDPSPQVDASRSRSDHSRWRSHSGRRMASSCLGTVTGLFGMLSLLLLHSSSAGVHEGIRLSSHGPTTLLGTVLPSPSITTTMGLRVASAFCMRREKEEGKGDDEGRLLPALELRERPLQFATAGDSPLLLPTGNSGETSNVKSFVFRGRVQITLDEIGHSVSSPHIVQRVRYAAYSADFVAIRTGG